MVKSHTILSIKVSMSSLTQCFTAIAVSIKETKKRHHKSMEYQDFRGFIWATMISSRQRWKLFFTREGGPILLVNIFHKIVNVSGSEFWKQINKTIITPRVNCPLLTIYLGQ